MAPIIQTMNIQNGYQQKYNPQQSSAQPNFSAASPTQTNFSANTGTGNATDAIVQSNPLLNAAASTPENPVSFLGQAVAAFAGLLGVNHFINNPLLTKPYDTTVFKKIELWGDKVGNKEAVKSVGNFLSSVKNQAKNLVNKSEILKTLFYKPSLGGHQVMSQAAGTKGHLASRAIDIMKDYKAKTGFSGFDAILTRAKDNAYLHYDEIIRTIKNSGLPASEMTKVISSKPWWGFGLVKNNKTLQEVINKDILIQNYKGAGKTLGQKLSGYFMRGTECLTNGVFSGKGQVLIQALMIAQSLNEASKAEKGEKVSTFMASFAELMAFMATMGVQQRVVNHLAGLKYVGFTPTQVNEYKNAIKLANEAVKNKDAVAHAANALKASNLSKLAASGLKWYQKPVRWIGNLLSFGRIQETIKPMKSGMISNVLSKIGYGLKVGTGYAGRVALIMAVIIPIFAGLAKKTSYAIFGKPKKTLEREKQKELAEAEKAKQEQLAYEKQLEEAAKAQQQQQVNTVQQTQQMQQSPQQYQQSVPSQGPVQRGNLVDKMMNMHNQNHQQIASQPIASQPIANQPIAGAPVQQSPDAGIKRTYVPNPVLGPEITPAVSETRTAAIDKIMRQADVVEAQAAQYL